MATYGIGRPVVVSKEGAKAFERMLRIQQRLVEANQDLVKKKESHSNFSKVRSLSQVK